MELLLLVFFCLLTGSEVTFDAENEPEVITVKEGRDVTLPCSLREDITNKKFEWKKDGRQVFLYDDGDHSNNDNTGQDQQFKGRVSHFSNKLNSGNASIIIRNMKVAETGNYTCEFPDLQPRQIFSMKLIVYVTSPHPCVRILEQRGKSAVLQCEVQGGFPKPELHWQDGDGNKLPADELQESERGGLFYIILQTTVTKTGNYRCVATQKETNHQADADIPVDIPEYTAGEIAAIVIGVVVAVAVGVLAVLIWMGYITIKFNKVTSPHPCVRKLEQTEDGMLLQCEVRGAFPKPELHWQDGAGNKLPAEEPQESERGGLYDIILQTTVTKTNHYRCVVTQKEIYQTTDVDIPVYTNGTTIIRVKEGRDVMLPCSLSKQDITNKKFVWKIGDCQVFLYDKDTVNSQTQHQQFKGRVKHFPDELKSGITSIIIRDMKVADSGYYTCGFTHQPEQIFFIKLVVEPEVIIVKEGKDAILPCLLSTEVITPEKFVWKKDGRQVFLHHDGFVNDNNSQTQHQQFRGRVSHFPDKLKSGNASIIIRDTKVTDTGLYTCESPDLQPEQIFRMKLVVEPAAPTAPGKGSAQDRKKTDGCDVDEAGLPLMNEDSRV